MAKLLNISEDECASDAFLNFYSGDQSQVLALKSWCTPYALTIMGTPRYDNCPFGNGNGYGDGRAVSVGEVVVDGRRWELQLKGGGTTPFCRGADGRAVLRSSIREFLVSEAMHNLGVETTRALCLIVSRSEKVDRPWYSGSTDGPNVGNPDTRIREPCAITTRVAPSFLRVGHVDLFARRARANGDANQCRELELMVLHALFREYPDVAPDMPLAIRAVAMLEAAAERFGVMVAHWLRVGFCQGNFNADNCLVGGRTMDYGPFGFIEKYDPLFAKWVGSGSHFAFMNQPAAAVANYKTLVESVAPVLDDERRKMVPGIARQGERRIQALADAVWCAKLGFSDSESDVAKELWKELESLLLHSEADYTLFWRQLAAVAELRAESDDSLLNALVDVFYKPLTERLTPKWVAWLRRWLSALDGVSAGASVCISKIVQKPELNGQTGKVTAWEPQKMRWGVRLEDGSTAALKRANLELEPSSPQAQVVGARGGAEGAPQRLRAVNPKYVPREWMLVDAYRNAGQGDYSLVHELYDLFLEPYAEQPHYTSKYYRRAPADVLMKGGIAKMS